MLKQLKEQGWTIALSTSNHYVVRKGGDRVWLPSTPSDVRAIRNVKAEFKRRGVEL